MALTKVLLTDPFDFPQSLVPIGMTYQWSAKMIAGQPNGGVRMVREDASGRQVVEKRIGRSDLSQKIMPPLIQASASPGAPKRAPRAKRLAALFILISKEVQ